MSKNAFAIAMRTLIWMETRRLSERQALAIATSEFRMSNPNAVRYAYKLVSETVRRKNLIDKFINSVLKPKTIGDFFASVQAFLRIYIYQTRIAKNWVDFDLNEAKNIARMGRAILGWKTLVEVEPFLGFMLTRTLDSILETANYEEKIGLQTFHPTWFVKYCINLFGKREAIVFLEGNVNPPSTYISLNTLLAPENEILEKLSSEGLKVQKAEFLKRVYKVVEARKPLVATGSFQEGLFYVQDKASCFAGQVAEPKSEMTVLDVCAAPGAKTIYLSQLMHNKGAIFSIDYSIRRLKIWKKEICRMGVKIAEPVIADARIYIPFAFKADVAVLDPPCTSTGAFGRFPSAKWRLTSKSIEKMTGLQKQMISNSAEKVKTGGFLVYSTCSITVEENEMVIKWFLDTNPEFSLVEINPDLGLPGLRGFTKCRRLYPHIHDCNGFFVAKLQKK